MTSRDPHRLADAAPEVQRQFVVEAILADPVSVGVLERARALGLPDHALMAGSVYKAVWNALTGRPPAYGVNDYDLAYFDASDLSAEAESALVRKSMPVFDDLDAEVEICNQARVHIWFSADYGVHREPLRDTADAVRHFASETHMVAVRFDEEGRLDVIAPLGLNSLFSLVVEPVPGIANPAGWNAKCDEQAELWPELRFVHAPLD